MKYTPWGFCWGRRGQGGRYTLDGIFEKSEQHRTRVLLIPKYVELPLRSP